MPTSPMTTQFVPIASDEETDMFKLVNFVILCGLLSPFGVITNVINIVVFVKLGFHDSMNISLMGLAVSDLVSLVSMLFISLCYNPLFANTGLPFDPLDVLYMVGGGVHVCFARLVDVLHSDRPFRRITSLITAFITFERCLCIAMPLKVKLIITPKRTKLINLSIFAVMFIVFSPFYFVNKLVWSFDADRNTTILIHAYTDDRVIVETVTFLIHGVIFSVFCFVLVICCTVILVVKLNSKTKWREATAAKGVNPPGGLGVKDKRVVKMVTFISFIFIVCFFPATAILMALALVPDLAFGAKYENMWFVVWSVSCLTETVNSSVNIFVYLRMSSKFRYVFMKTFLNKEEKKVSRSSQ
ncbi:thyrotropin-releasing hormone receptor-like [Aplysia californica]|uniref:Thyrotropin-releasing hormone receptor-like n=1 Tax=Aplysia californica TaxID=6500 RepID=A0ABM0JXM0_APLCA|nr:thyrotropin-releasing hormone receptor-like [Aplysia californica]